MTTLFARGRRWMVLAGALAILHQACATATRKDAVPDDLQAAATVPGFSASIRYFPTDATHVQEFEKDFLQSNAAEMMDRYNRGEEVTGLPPVSYLAISGGGDNGAFGAGLLNGWTAAGTRPEFKLVTGVSTGALIAPFAFLGDAYDPTLKAIYTGVSMSDIAKKRSVVSIIYGDAMADTTPLRKLVERTVTQQVLDAIAVENARGRILLVATTNLDVRRPVVWNVTKIAASKAPGSLELVQKILVASAAIPGTFPPVMIDVDAKGKAYQEMHVDGGTTGQVFVYPAAIHVYELAQRQRSLYIIRNARLDPQWAQVDRRTLPIAFRAITTLIQYQGMGDLYTIFSLCERDHVEYNLAYIPSSFDAPHKTDFDTAYMQALFEVGQRMAVKGQDWWYKHPPVLLSGVNEAPQVY
jgi:predicted patatin/cPLA2 family phospholipase